MSNDDQDLFAAAMSDVTPLKKSNKIDAYDREEQIARGKRILRDNRRKRMQKTHPELELDRKQVFSKVGAFDKLLYSQKGVQLREINRLKNGDFAVQAVLDLHGNTEEQAEILLNCFLADAIVQKLRFIRIIHGKGYNSENDYPVLKNLTNQILRQCRPVIAFSSAAEKDGGVGAVNILLKS